MAIKQFLLVLLSTVMLLCSPVAAQVTKCPSGQKYNTFQKKCLKIVCPSGMTYYGGMCQKGTSMG